MNKKSLQDHIMPVDLALVNYVQDLEALFAAVTETTEIVEDNKKQNVSTQSKVSLLGVKSGIIKKNVYSLWGLIG